MPVDSPLILSVTRKVPTGPDPKKPEAAGYAHVQAELVTWAGIRLMVHENINSTRILSSEPWVCADERTDFLLARGATPELALASGIAKIRSNWSIFHTKRAELQTINPVH